MEGMSKAFQQEFCKEQMAFDSQDVVPAAV